MQTNLEERKISFKKKIRRIKAFVTEKKATKPP